MKKTERFPIRNRGLKMIPYGNREEFLKIRKKYIGGSDAGAIIGLNPYNSAFAVWAEKTGKTEPFGGNIATRTGTLLEDLVARLFTEETGKKVQRLNFTLVNEAYPFACANLDREIIGEDAFLECKTTNNYVNIRQFKSGEFPDIYYAQVVHYMAVTGAKKAYLAVLSECRDFRIFELERDEDEIAALMEAERLFWETYVIPMTPPPADGSPSTSETIKKLYPADCGENADLTEFENDLVRRSAVNKQIKELEAEIDEIDNRIKAAMKECSAGTCGQFSVSWKAQSRNSFDKAALAKDMPDLDLTKYNKQTQSRVFRVTEIKPKKS